MLDRPSLALGVLLLACNNVPTGARSQPAVHGEFQLTRFGSSLLPVTFDPQPGTDPPGCQPTLRSGFLMIDREHRFVLHLDVVDSCRLPPPPGDVYGTVRQRGEALTFTSASQAGITGNYLGGEIALVSGGTALVFR